MPCISCEGLAVEILQVGETRAELAQRGKGRRRERGLGFEILADRPAAGHGQRAFELTPPMIGRLRAGDEIHELGVAEQGRQIGAGLVGLEPCGRVCDLPQERVSQQHLQQARIADRRLRIGPGENELLDVARRGARK